MKFHCDAMLAGLARWLRAAGHDTSLASTESDREILETAARECRVLLTRDRQLAGRTVAIGRVLLLEGETVPEQAVELRQKLGVDWLHRPFTRCVVDNAILRDATADEIAALPLGVREGRDQFTTCPKCKRVYWRGDHHKRMLARLQQWMGQMT